MNRIAVIAEYNPFHNGHHYMLRTLRSRFGSSAPIVVVMSGSFVQRGEPALFDKWTRASWALDGGADCVVELPALYALSSAEGFAAGAVRLAARLGCTHLSCGVENGTADDFHRLAQASLAVLDDFRPGQTGLTYGQYVSQATASQTTPETAALLGEPNALLALEYVKAIHRYAPSFEFVPILRQGKHDGADLTGPFASASAIRRELQAGRLEDAAPYLPAKELADIGRLLSQGQYADYSRYGDCILYRSRLLSPQELLALPAFSEGLENRWQRCLLQSTSWPEALDALKTKRYAYSRLRRMGAYTALAVSRADMEKAYLEGPQYGRVLALSPLGASVLKEAKKEIPIITRLRTGLNRLSPFGQRMIQYDMRSTDIQSLCFRSPSGRGGLKDYYASPSMKKSIFRQ